jgi:hypothetical protein
MPAVTSTSSFGFGWNATTSREKTQALGCLSDSSLSRGSVLRYHRG